MPLITVIIPALNEEETLAACLSGLKSQSLSADQFEVVVVDNGSTDKTLEIAAGFDVRVISEPRKSAYVARNTAICASDSQYIAFTDADCRPDAHWLTSFLEVARSRNDVIAGGLTLYELAFDSLANRLLAERKQPKAMKNAVEHSSSIACGNLFVDRNLFRQLGLFRAAMSGADIEFSKRAASHGYLPVFVENAIVHHQCDFSNSQYVRRTFGEQFGQARLDARNRKFGGVLESVLNLPLRPGISNLRSGVSDWYFRWTDRWFGYAGRVRGSFCQWRDGDIEIPEYKSRS